MDGSLSKLNASELYNQKKLNEINKQEKEELVENLNKKKENNIYKEIISDCPFPHHKGYSRLWENITYEEQKNLSKNIGITNDQKIEIIPMHKKFSILTAIPNNKDIFDCKDLSREHEIGTSGVICFTGDAMKRICIEQHKKLLKNKVEVEKFINIFPGETVDDKVWNFILLFDLLDAFHTSYEEKGNHWSYAVGNQRFSEIDENDNVYGVYWSNVCGHSFYAEINDHNKNIYAPYIVNEDI